MFRRSPRHADARVAAFRSDATMDRDDLTIDLLRLGAAVLTFAMAIVIAVAR